MTHETNSEPCRGCYPAQYTYTCTECGKAVQTYYVHRADGTGHAALTEVCGPCRNSVEYRAKQAAGNHRKFDSFAWFERPEDSELWMLEYVSNRDSDALARSNARVIAQRMKPFVENGTARKESHTHWAVGYVDGYAVRVYTDRSRTVITDAFRQWLRIADALESYPVLDEDDFSEEEQREADETWRTCYTWRERIAYIRENRDGCNGFEFMSLTDMIHAVRGEYFPGIASEFISW